MWGITSQEHTHLAPGPHSHTVTQAVCKIREASTKTQRRVKRHTHTVSHSWTEARKQTHNPTCQACGKGLSEYNESYTETSLLEPLNVSFFLFEEMPVVPNSSSCFHIEHNVPLMLLTDWSEHEHDKVNSSVCWCSGLSICIHANLANDDPDLTLLPQSKNSKPEKKKWKRRPMSGRSWLNSAVISEAVAHGWWCTGCQGVFNIHIPFQYVMDRWHINTKHSLISRRTVSNQNLLRCGQLLNSLSHRSQAYVYTTDCV